MHTIARATLSLVSLATLATLSGAAWADPKAAEEARVRAETEAKAKASADLGKVSAVLVKHQSKVDDAKKKVGFDSGKFEAAIAVVHKESPGKLKDATDSFVKSWQAPTEKVLLGSGIDLAAEAKALAAQLSASVLGGQSLAFLSGASSGASTDLPSGTKTVIVPGTAGPLVPIKATGLATATPLGILHAHAVSHSPLGNVVLSSAGYETEISVPAGSKRLIVEVPLDVPLALTLAAAAAGAAASESSVQLRVIEHRPEGNKEVCVDHRSVARSAVAVVGLAPNVKPGTWANVSCKVLRATPDKAQKYTVVIQGSAAAVVKAVGGSHAVLDAKVKTPKVMFEK